MNTRLDEFIEFHRYCCWNDSIVIQLKAYADLCGLSQTQREWLVFFYSMTYSIPSAIICLKHFEEIKSNPELFWSRFKSKLIFQSDRRWVKFNNQFVGSFLDFAQKGVFKALRGNDAIDLDKALAMVQKVSYFARFSAFLFLEAYCFMFQRQTFNDGIDWKHGDTATSGMMNVLRFDSEANEFDKTGRLLVSEPVLSAAVKYIQGRIPENDCKSTLFIETTLCAFRKHFKGTRYVGYYVDRVQGELEETIKTLPEHLDELVKLYDARAAVLPIRQLGEFNGWHGIRKKLCKHYILTGDWHV